MRAFVLGIILTIVAAFIVVLLIAQFGLFPTNADANPSSLERRIAMSAMDAVETPDIDHLSRGGQSEVTV